MQLSTTCSIHFPHLVPQFSNFRYLCNSRISTILRFSTHSLVSQQSSLRRVKNKFALPMPGLLFPEMSHIAAISQNFSKFLKFWENIKKLKASITRQLPVNYPSISVNFRQFPSICLARKKTKNQNNQKTQSGNYPSISVNFRQFVWLEQKRTTINKTHNKPKTNQTWKRQLPVNVVRSKHATHQNHQNT